MLNRRTCFSHWEIWLIYIYLFMRPAYWLAENYNSMNGMKFSRMTVRGFLLAYIQLLGLLGLICLMAFAYASVIYQDDLDLAESANRGGWGHGGNSRFIIINFI